MSSVTKVTKRTLGLGALRLRLTVPTPLKQTEQKMFCSAAATALKVCSGF
ncbi:MAG: hypothetical protein IKK09_05245 [Clostridia bacterium]|nr:hypothetical protein [Clostridia bacterium]